MQKVAYGTLTLAVLLPLMTGCELTQGLREVVVPADSEVTVPGTAFGAPQNPLAPADVVPADFGALLSDQVAQQISTEGVPKEAVESMTLTLFTLEVEDPVQGGQQVRDLGFLESVAFSLGAGDIEPKLVASSPEGAFDDDPIELALDLTGEELVDVLNAADEMEMVADVVIGPQRPDFDTTVLFHAEVTIVIDPLGAAAAGGS